MCGRFTLSLPTYSDLANLLGATPDPAIEALYRPRYNVAPTNVHLVLRAHEGHRELVPARWGLINHWAKDASSAARQINARSETARQRPAFRDALERRRCVVPADGFYEWTGPKGARRPLWFHAPSGGLLHLAGLYESWRNPETGEPVRTFTILTTAANDLIAPMHDRMPAILSADDVDAWLAVPDGVAKEDGEEAVSAEEASALLRPAANDALVPRPVSTRVNAVTYDGPDLLDEAREEEATRTSAIREEGARATASPRRKVKPAPEEEMPLFARVKRA